MAKPKGLIKIEGTIDGLTYYTLNGQLVVRKKGGGFHTEAIKHGKHMSRVRENATEFGHCSHVGKELRQVLRPFYHGIKYTGLHGRVAGMLTNIKNLDPLNERGVRKVGEGLHTEAGRQLLMDFDFTPAFRSFYNWKCECHYDSGRHTFTPARLPNGLQKAKLTPYLKLAVVETDFEDYYALNDLPWEALKDNNSEIVLPDEGNGLFQIVVMGVRFAEEDLTERLFRPVQNQVGLGVVQVVAK